MNEFDILDSIGNTDDELVEKAKQPKNSHRKALIAIGSLAACAVIGCVGLLIAGQNKSDMTEKGTFVSSDGASAFSGTTGTSSETPHNEDSVETAVENISVKVYYVANGQLNHKTMLTAAKPQTVFEIWKSENDIGSEVELVNSNLSYDSAEASEYEYSGIGAATHETSGRTTYTLKVTKNIENYYNAADSELLLESLRKTMTEMNDTPPDDYDLVLVEESEVFYEDDEILTDDESECNQIDQDNIMYNDQGEILE